MTIRSHAIHIGSHAHVTMHDAIHFLSNGAQGVPIVIDYYIADYATAALHLFHSLDATNVCINFHAGINSVITCFLAMTGSGNVQVSYFAQQYATFECNMRIVARNADKITINTIQHHAISNATSKMNIRAVVADNAYVHYSGSIKIEQECEQSHAEQKSHFLITSKYASARAQPVLEVVNNNVTCGHGSALGTFDQTQLVYLALRGITESHAKKLLAHAFLQLDLLVQHNANALIDVLNGVTWHKE